jgi:hypothetical protein
MRAQINPEYYIFQMKHLLPKSIHARTSSAMSISEIGLQLDMPPNHGKIPIFLQVPSPLSAISVCVALVYTLTTVSKCDFFLNTKK